MNQPPTKWRCTNASYVFAYAVFGRFTNEYARVSQRSESLRGSFVRNPPALDAGETRFKLWRGRYQKKLSCGCAWYDAMAIG